MKYLRTFFNGVGSCDKEIENRIGAASKVIGSMRIEILDQGRKLNKNAKLRVFNVIMVLPTLLYGCESWTVQKQEESRVQAMEMRFLRRMERLTKLDRVRNVDIRQGLQQAAVMDIVTMT